MHRDGGDRGTSVLKGGSGDLGTSVSKGGKGDLDMSALKDGVSACHFFATLVSRATRHEEPRKLYRIKWRREARMRQQF